LNNHRKATNVQDLLPMGMIKYRLWGPSAVIATFISCFSMIIQTIDNVIYMYIYFDENLIKSKLAKF
jgi:hypothetical protein